MAGPDVSEASRRGSKAVASDRWLAQLLAKHGRRGDARVLFVEIDNWFTKDFDIADLRDAKGSGTNSEVNPPAMHPEPGAASYFS